jgi:ABC-type phosphate transport system substrate-binding protein
MRKTTSLSLLSLLLLSFATPARAGRQLSVIVHPSCPLSSLTADVARAHYLRQHKEWSDGSKVRPVAQAGDAQGGLLAKVLKMPVMDYERYWLERKYAAAESPPKTVDDDSDVIKFVGAMKGAIGAVDASQLDDAAKSKVKTVLSVGY